jgi:beta-glucosidase
MARARMLFPHDFLWGTSTAAHQVEGDNRNNDWWSWEQEEGNITQGHKSALACDWWRNAEADLDSAAEMGTNAHRFSLEWSRIEPEPSVFDPEALDRYRTILKSMHERGIEPMVTLHHFSNPTWLVEKGDFNTKVVVDYFQRYTAKVVDELGDLIPKWITINEPLVYVFNRFVERAFPAAKRSGWLAGLHAIRILLHCHAVAYHTIKDRYPNAMVGMAKNMAVIEPRPGGNRLDRSWVKWVSWFFNHMWVESMADGRLRWPVGRGKTSKLAGTFDFVGINYYTRLYLKFPPRSGFYDREWGEKATVSDGNFSEVHPEGIFQILQSVLRYGKPIYITENGLPDEKDKLRPSFILAHLREIWRAISFCFPVMGYYHWSLVDNFEWHLGWTKKFGLIEMDPETQERRWRASARLYRAICQSRSISSEMAEQYAPELMNTVFRGEAPPALVPNE